MQLIGLGRIEAPEDVILDRHDNLYAGSRHGDVIRFFAPDYEHMEVFAHIGGQPLGMAFDRDDNLHVCVGGMGLYRIKPDQTVELRTVKVARAPLPWRRMTAPWNSWTRSRVPSTVRSRISTTSRWAR